GSRHKLDGVRLRPGFVRGRAHARGGDLRDARRRSDALRRRVARRKRAAVSLLGRHRSTPLAHRRRDLHRTESGRPSLLRSAERREELSQESCDITRPDDHGRLVAPLAPRAKVLVVSSQAAPSSVRRALTAGAAGYLPKRSSDRELVAAIRLVASGAGYVEPDLGAQPVLANGAPALEP